MSTIRDCGIIEFLCDYGDDNFKRGIPGQPVPKVGDPLTKLSIEPGGRGEGTGGLKVLCRGVRQDPRDKGEDGKPREKEFVSLSNVFISPTEQKVVVGGWREYSLYKGRIQKRESVPNKGSKLPGIFYWIEDLKEGSNTLIQDFLLEKAEAMGEARKEFLLNEAFNLQEVPEFPDFHPVNRGCQEVPNPIHDSPLLSVKEKIVSHIMGVVYCNPVKFHVGVDDLWAANMAMTNCIQFVKSLSGTVQRGKLTVSYQLSV